jgi:hypothetical protein
MARVARIAVVALWVGLLIALTRAPPPSASAPAPALERLPDAGDDTWTGVYMHGEKVGYGHTQTARVDDGYRITDVSLLRLSVLDRIETVRAVTDATTSADFALQAFRVTVDSGPVTLEVHGMVEPQALVLTMTSGGGTSTERVPLSEPLYLPEAARAHLRTAGFAPGRTITARVFDPSAMEHHPLELHVVGRDPVAVGEHTVDAWKVIETFRGMQSTAWLDDRGQTLCEDGPLGMRMVREDPERAVHAGWRDTPFDLMAAVAIRVSPPIRNPRDLARLRARLSGLAGVPVPVDQRQSFAGGVLDVRRERPRSATYRMPYHEDARRADLVATPFLQVDDPRIQDTARGIIGTETDPRLASAALRAWVFTHLRKEPMASIPNALQVLDAGAGDCNEHAVLFAALARAAGIPARVVAGVVYADGAFLYHAWNEVWLGTEWLSVDPTFDQSPADATHIKLVEGGPEAHATLLPVIGSLGIELLGDDADRAGS